MKRTYDEGESNVTAAGDLPTGYDEPAPEARPLPVAELEAEAKRLRKRFLDENPIAALAGRPGFWQAASCLEMGLVLTIEDWAEAGALSVQDLYVRITYKLLHPLIWHSGEGRAAPDLDELERRIAVMEATK